MTAARWTEIVLYVTPTAREFQDEVRRKQRIVEETTVRDLKAMISEAEPNLFLGKRLRLFHGGPIGIGKEMEDDRRVLSYGTKGYARLGAVYIAGARDANATPESLKPKQEPPTIITLLSRYSATETFLRKNRPI